jgi:hypothetical protein
MQPSDLHAAVTLGHTLAMNDVLHSSACRNRQTPAEWSSTYKPHNPTYGQTTCIQATTPLDSTCACSFYTLWLLRTSLSCHHANPCSVLKLCCHTGPKPL